jgi:DNA polymerase-3 subunit epsilon
MSWHTRPLCGFDLETTGVDVETARIVTAAVVDYIPGVTSIDTLPDHARLWLSDVDGAEIPTEASNIHGVTTEQARSNGRRAIEVVGEVAQALADQMREGVAVVAMNGRYDFTVLDRELRRHGLATLEELLGRPVSPVIDPLVLDKAADKYRSGSRKLEALAKHYGVVLTAAHTADADALAAVEVAVAIGASFERLQVDAGQVHAWQIRWAAEQAISYQEYRRRTEPGFVAPAEWPLIPYRESILAPHLPHRGDAVEAWLKSHRDQQHDQYGATPIWWALDNLLDRYRLHADTGTPLGEHTCTAIAVGGCDCLEAPAP